MLSNLVRNQNIDGYDNKLIITKDLLGKIIQIAMSSRAVAHDPESSKFIWEKYQSLFLESMFVITILMKSCDEESVFFQIVNDKAIIELLAFCMLEQTQLNIPDKLLYFVLVALEIALNYSHFNNEESTCVLDFEFKEHLLHVTQNEGLKTVLAHKNYEIAQKAISIEADYLENDGDDMIEDQNMIAHENTNGGHLFDDTKFNI